MGIELVPDAESKLSPEVISIHEETVKTLRALATQRDVAQVQIVNIINAITRAMGLADVPYMLSPDCSRMEKMKGAVPILRGENFPKKG